LGSGVTKNQGYDNATDKGKYFLFQKHDFSTSMLTTWKKLGAEATYLFDIPRVGEELVVDGLELAGAWLEHPRDDIWSSL
jgi:hypothetical protein